MASNYSFVSSTVATMSNSTLPVPVTAEDLLHVDPGMWQDALTPLVWHSFQAAHTLLTILALLSNCITLVVVYGIVTHLTPILQLLTSLGFTCMLAPWAVMTLYFPASTCQDEIHTALLLTSHNAASLTLLLLAVCHYVATFTPLHYERIMSARRLWLAINVIWVASIVGAHIHFLAVLSHPHAQQTFCMQVLENTDLALTLAAAITAATSAMAILAYTRIYIHLRPLHTFALASSCECQQVETPRKSIVSVVTAMVLTTAFLLCWLPYLVTKFVQVEWVLFDHRPTLTILSLIQTLILLFAFLSPIWLSLRMQSLQTGYLTLYHKWRGWARSKWQKLRQRSDTEDLPCTPLNPIESIC